MQLWRCLALSKQLRKSDIRSLNEELPVELDKKDKVILVDDVLLVNDSLHFLRIEDSWVPALPLLLDRPQLLPQLVVDMGAVRFVVNGADIMRPGIVEVPEVDEGSLVTVVDERNRKPLAVGRVKVSGEAMQSMDSGNVVESLHYVGDTYWEKHSN